MDTKQTTDIAKFIKKTLDAGLDYNTGNMDWPLIPGMSELDAGELAEHPAVKKAFIAYLEGILAMGEDYEV